MRVYVVFDVFNDFIESIWKDFDNAEDHRKIIQKKHDDLNGRPYNFKVQEYEVRESIKD